MEKRPRPQGNGLYGECIDTVMDNGYKRHTRLLWGRGRGDEGRGDEGKPRGHPGGAGTGRAPKGTSRRGRETRRGCKRRPSIDGFVGDLLDVVVKVIFVLAGYVTRGITP